MHLALRALTSTGHRVRGFGMPWRWLSSSGAPKPGFEPTCRKTGRGVCEPVSKNEGWEHLIRASQHPRVCHRWLVVEDDMMCAGLGFAMWKLASLLLIAIKENRVLIEVPVGTQPHLPLVQQRAPVMRRATRCSPLRCSPRGKSLKRYG